MKSKSGSAELSPRLLRFILIAEFSPGFDRTFSPSQDERDSVWFEGKNELVNRRYELCKTIAY